jgi:hypothetical protein
MKKTFFTICNLMIFSLVLTSASNTITQQSIDDKKQSPFVGTWDWEKNSPEEDSFYIWVGERNDSLLFTMGGVFYKGSRIHNSEWDEEGKALQMIRIKKQKGRIIKTKISEGVSSWIYHKDSANNYNDISFELLNDSTMRFTLNDSRSYWPDTAIMLRRDYTNPDFSDKTYEHMYKEK